MAVPQDLARLAAAEHAVIKQEPAATVERFGRPADAVVVKTYRNRGLRRLQTFGRRSRAAREFANLRALESAGVPCTPPLWWTERRSGGCVAESVLATRFLADSRTLKQVLAGLPRDARVRGALAAAMGALVASLHRAGVLWCTPMPRNVLVLGAAADCRLAVCDVPAAACLGRSLHGTALARVDLFDAAFSPSRRADFSAAERLRWLRGYCGGDRALERRLWSALARRSLLRHDLGRALAMAWHTYFLAAVRRRRATPSALPR